MKSRFLVCNKREISYFWIFHPSPLPHFWSRTPGVPQLFLFIQPLELAWLFVSLKTHHRSSTTSAMFTLSTFLPASPFFLHHVISSSCDPFSSPVKSFSREAESFPPPNGLWDYKPTYWKQYFTRTHPAKQPEEDDKIEGVVSQFLDYLTESRYLILQTFPNWNLSLRPLNLSVSNLNFYHVAVASEKKSVWQKCPCFHIEQLIGKNYGTPVKFEIHF